MASPPRDCVQALVKSARRAGNLWFTYGYRTSPIAEGIGQSTARREPGDPPLSLYHYLRRSHKSEVGPPADWESFTRAFHMWVYPSPGSGGVVLSCLGALAGKATLRAPCVAA